MCGILGGNNEKWNYNAALETLRHRGPDGQRINRIKDFFLGFVRLSIIDLHENAMQPMFSDDGRYAIVFNGEIYGYQKLRNELIAKGYTFQTLSDTEVLLYAFEEWKEKVMDHLDGICAFAIMDILQEKIYLFRDRCGVKPLYYYYNGNEFAFASELKGIVRLCDNITFRLDNTALYDYYTYLYIPEPKTMYKHVYKLPAASYLVYDCKKKKIDGIKKYWKVKLNTHAGEPVSQKKLNDKADELKYHLNQVVKKQIVADVPVGTFLSGGVDSSIITAVVHSHINNITAYSIGFDDKRYDESVYAKEIAEIIGINCKVKTFHHEDFKKFFNSLVSIYDEPFADTSAYPTYYVSKFAREDVTVVLTGDGADELFGGYSRCVLAKELLDEQKISNRKLSELYLQNENIFKNLGKEFEMFCREDVALLPLLYQYSKRPDRNRLRNKYAIPRDYDDFWYYRKYYHKDLPPYTRMRYFDFMTYLNGDILTKVDRASMSVSLEARVPFLDREIIDFAFSLTQEECNPSGEQKGLLKQAYKDIIPINKLNRQKQGFGIPFSYIRKGECPQDILIEKVWNL